MSTKKFLLLVNENVKEEAEKNYVTNFTLLSHRKIFTWKRKKKKKCVTKKRNSAFILQF